MTLQYAFLMSFKIATAKLCDFEATKKCFRRIQEANRLEGKIEFPSPLKPKEEELEAGRILILKEQGRVYGGLIFTHDVKKAFFPHSSSWKELDSLLEDCGSTSESLLAITSFFIDPSYRHKGLGGLLLQDWMRRYPQSDIFLACPLDHMDVAPFFQKKGFQIGKPLDILGIGKTVCLYYLHHSDGLCRNLFW